MNKTKLIGIIYLLLQFSVFGSNPLGNFVEDKVYNDAIKRFPKNEDIFKTKVYSREAFLEKVEEAETRIRSIFVDVVMTAIDEKEKRKNQEYSATFYYINEAGKKTRKIITGRKKMVIGDYTYVVEPESNHVIKIIDVLTKIEVKVERQKVGRLR